jgi:hypothetical protein
VNNTKLGLGAVALVVAVAGTAGADPEFCKTPGVNAMALHGAIDDALGDDPSSALANLVAASCGKAGAEGVQRAGELAAARGKWSKRLALSEAEWADVALWATHSPAERNAPTLRYDAKQAWSTFDPIEQYANLMPVQNDPHYLADALGTRLSETGRLAYLTRCLASSKHGEWAICAPDLTALDPVKLAGELRASTKHDGYERMVIRLALDRMRGKLVEQAATLKQLAAKDPAYGKLFAIAADTRATWTARPPATALLDLALAMDDARVTASSKAYDGCDERTWAAMRTAVAAIPAKEFAGLKDEPGLPFMQGAIGVIVNDPSSYLAAVAHYTCKRDGKRDVLNRFLGNALQRWPGHRGPRTASHTAMVKAAVKLDDRDAKLEYPEVRRMWFDGSESSHGGGRGPVSAVKPGGETTVIEFVKKLRTEQVCTDWKDTNQISMISASGTVYYEYNCLKYGKITVNDAPRPQTVSTRYAAGIKPGASVSIVEDLVGGVWAKPGGAPVAVFGIPVK